MGENIFALLSKASAILKAIGEDPKPMMQEAVKAKSYKEACEIIKKYVDLSDLEEEEVLSEEEESDF